MYRYDSIKKGFVKSLLLAVPLIGVSGIFGPAHAEVSTETAFILNSFLFLFCGVLVMFMAAGFAMLEAGLVRTKNTATICLKNIALYAIAGLSYYIIGYQLMYTDVSGYIGSVIFGYGPSDAEIALLGAEEVTDKLIAPVVENGYSVASDWFFQMVFVATAASIVSGTVAERIKMWPFLIFVFCLTAVIYPIQGAWSWGGGWLSEMGFSDFAGSTIVHSVGGWAALTGALILGARKGKYNAVGRVMPMPGANLPLATLGTFILWFGWFGFNGGSVLAMGSAKDVTAISMVFANTNIAAAAGVIAAMIVTQALYKKVDLTMALNGALAGLVSITAGPDLMEWWKSALIGGIGGGLVVITVPLLDRFKIDDVVGAIPVHLVCGIWGTLAVGLFGAGDFWVQVTGIVTIGLFTILASTAIWMILKLSIGLRVSEEEEDIGLDKTELGLEAYPEFGRGSQIY